MRSFLLGVASQLLFPVTLVFAAYLLVRGHNDPGGGFSAGLVSTLAIVIQAFAFGVDWTRSRLHAVLRPAAWVGLMVASLAALTPALWGEPILTHHHVRVPLGEGGISLSSTLLFDIGVYGVVVGTSSVFLGVLSSGGGR